ncbi:MAG: NAD(P)H-quinone oxidoreductase [Alphaproteobacteria bacterium]|nr:NAD(P)H-quinone oxidoreductase [Alphaproteobacteria bacterium]MBU0858317.1 NAD(P)H-quinone oxidoreductase [Alphaproteobacteria bacterium]
MDTQLQDMMQAVEIRDNALFLTTRPTPVPAEGEVLIHVAAAGLNRPDILQRRGLYPPPPGITDIPGLEVAGTVVQSRSPDWAAGDKVCALLSGGGYAEYAIVPAGQCLPAPANLSLAEAAALPETVFTVWNNVFVRGQLKRGETILIHGGTSGIGTTAIQMAKAFGARVIITAGSDEKCNACRELGADIAINYKTHDFGTAITEGVDVVLDMVGGDYVPRNLALLNTDGRHVSIAFVNGAKTEIDLNHVMRKRLIVTGSTLRPRTVAEKTELAAGIKTHIWPLVQSGAIRPLLFKTFPLAQAAQAHEALEKGDHIGKIVLLNG